MMVLRKEVRFEGENKSDANVKKQRKRENNKTVDGKTEMTKSAPPQRTHSSARNTHGPGTGRKTSTAHAHKSKSSADLFAISLEDIYQSAERERLNYSSAIRRQNLAHAQSQTQFFRQGQSSPVSRPNTSASRHINAFRREANTPVSAWSEPNISRPNSIVPHPELRLLVENEDEDSNADEEEEDFDMTHHTPLTVTFSPVSRGECCEILGPQLCYECRKNRIRQVNRERSDMFFPTLEPSEENLTTAAIVRKYLPGLSEQEVEDKLARGEIARPSFKKHNKHIEFSDEEDEAKPKFTNKKVTIADTEKDKKAKAVVPPKPNELFFTNIRDLNSKIITGNVDRNVGFSSVARKVIKKDKQLSSKNYFPTFVSPRKVVMVQETNYKTYFDPPLIEKSKQDVEPAFFAGSAGEYTLPEKLPDELVFVDKDGNEVKASSSQGFTSKTPASAETKDNSSSKSVTSKPEPKSSGMDILKEDEEEENDEEDEEVHELLSTGESEINEKTEELNEKESDSIQTSTETGNAPEGNQMPNVKETGAS
ncbi:uncharacterized protein LOC123551082 isoform X2 [Mercenaria mercenaria]|uniref:uncharacterized protein LOC123551082 isoform X2 n=1 Tax=Mercenaria mercenaria TaxID=6596 RepID=UPI00234F3A2A|nr:uncharacterized protein LOC123551082 isoform X2 [Mercenaria mercenaria]